MVDLKAQDPFGDSLPLSIGAAELSGLDLGMLTSLSPFGDLANLSTALEDSHGITLPPPGKSSGEDGGRCIWFGRKEYLLIGPAPDAALSKYGAVVDQSDAWCAVALSGAASVGVLARLVPLDLRQDAFGRGATARTQLQHMNVSVTRLGPERFMILAFRSMAGTLVHDLKTAMEGMAARG